MLWEETAFLSYGPLLHMALGHAELQHFCFHEMSFCSFEHSSLNLLQIRRRTSSRPEIVSNFRDWFDLGKHCIWYPWLITETLFLMKIFMRAIWASPGVPTELQVCPWDPSFSTLVFTCGNVVAEGGCWDRTLCWNMATQVVSFKVLPMWTADESLLLRLALGPELEEKFWAIAGIRWK